MQVRISFYLSSLFLIASAPIMDHKVIQLGTNRAMTLLHTIATPVTDTGDRHSTALYYTYIVNMHRLLTFAGGRLSHGIDSPLLIVLMYAVAKVLLIVPCVCLLFLSLLQNLCLV